MARKWGEGALQRMLDKGKRELAETTVAFPGSTPIVQPDIANLHAGHDKLSGRIKTLEAREAERTPNIEMERE